jgi:quercetin dioxygenase-like cupin family protein
MRSSMGLTALFFAAAGCASAPRTTGGVKVVSLGSPEQAYVEVLHGPPETASMQSGVVSLAPGKSVGQHDTEDYEEIVIPLEGRGELRTPGSAPIALLPGLAAYSPPHTSHDVANVSGESIFRYVFVAARTR